MEAFSVSGKQEINLGEGGNELFIQQEQALRKNPHAIERITRDAFGKQTLVLGQSGKPIPVNPKLEGGQSIFQDMIGAQLEPWQFLSLVPDAMGQPVAQQRAAGRIRLARNGANIAEYLNEIRKLDPDAFNGIFESLQYVLPFAKDLQPALAS